MIKMIAIITMIKASLFGPVLHTHLVIIMIIIDIMMMIMVFIRKMTTIMMITIKTIIKGVSTLHFTPNTRYYRLKFLPYSHLILKNI
jgi:hypothetical protein